MRLGKRKSDSIPTTTKRKDIMFLATNKSKPHCDLNFKGAFRRFKPHLEDAVGWGRGEGADCGGGGAAGIRTRRTFLTGLAIGVVTDVMFIFVKLCKSRHAFFFASLSTECVAAIGSAATDTAALAIVAQVFPHNVAKMIGMVETFSGIACLFGQPMGGLLYQTSRRFLTPLVDAFPLRQCLTPLDDALPLSSIHYPSRHALPLSSMHYTYVDALPLSMMSYPFHRCLTPLVDALPLSWMPYTYVDVLPLSSMPYPSRRCPTNFDDALPLSTMPYPSRRSITPLVMLYPSRRCITLTSMPYPFR
ncbi:MFS-type transporter SLC18B1 [Apostichopus japonicus]|uniref:MFS-type transporter SLC18B1 n=1 Tax=Stichopus japonicus TaxID=307972 RepID=A0A2G8KPZ6_STIJA|nr:MFS-type transporter SLC18B1 [Apostichopus japonicus]